MTDEDEKRLGHASSVEVPDDVSVQHVAQALHAGLGWGGRGQDTSFELLLGD